MRKSDLADEEAGAAGVADEGGSFEQATALHDCKSNVQTKINEGRITNYSSVDQGSAEDPNELSFEKDEILDILDKRGNWWQARKQDGSTGIVPSNYVSLIMHRKL